MIQGTKKFKEFVEDLNPETTTYVVGYRPVDDEEVRVPLSLIGLSGDVTNKYIRKDIDDFANGNISFKRNIDIAGNIRSDRYIQNAMGWFGDNKGNFEMNSLRLREFLETPELRKNRITVMQNEFWFTDSATVSNAVLRNDGKYDIDFKLEEGEFVPFRAGDILKGIFNYDTGFYTVYIYVESLVYAEGSGAKSVVGTSMNGRPPAKAMLLARMNNMVDTGRQQSMFVDGLNGYIRVLSGFDEKNPTAQGTFDTLKVQLGNLKGIKGHPAFGDLEGYGLYANNVYLTGRIVQTDWKGDETQPLLYFKGLYSSVAIYWPYDSVRYVDEAGKEGVYYVKLRDDIMSTGITGILPTNEDYWELNQVGANGIDGRSLWTTYHDSIEKPAKPQTPQGIGEGWHIQPHNNCIWLCQKLARTVEEGVWSEPVKIGAIDGINGTWVSYVFKNSEDMPATPTSTTPIPIEGGWVDAPDSQFGKWWMSKAEVNGQTNQVEKSWSTPVQVTGDTGDAGADGSYTIYQFAKYKGTALPNPGSVTWHSEPPSLLEGEFLFMRMNTIYPPATTPSPDTWSNPVRISGEKGEKGIDGVDGDFSEFIYNRTALLDESILSAPDPGAAAVAAGKIEDPNKDYPAGGGNPSGAVNTPGYVPEGWMADPISVNESLPVGWIAKRYKVGNTWGRFSSPAINAKYGVDGVDGKSNEYIFFRYTSPIEPSAINPNASSLPGKQDDGFVPSDIGIGTGTSRVTWTNNASGVTETFAYEFMSKRIKVDGVWSAFSTPALWSKYGVDGKDGASVEMVFKRYNSNPGLPSPNENIDGSIPSGWTNNAMGTNSSYPIEWMSKRTKVNNMWNNWSQPVTWSTWVKGSNGSNGSDGSDGRDGAQGPAGQTGPYVMFMGDWQSNTTYYGNSTYVQAVKYGSYYYTVSSSLNGGTTSTPGYSPWIRCNSFSMVATDVLLAQRATISGWYFDSSYIWSKNNNFLLNGSANAAWPIAIGTTRATTEPQNCPFRVDSSGGLFAANAKITGEINATSGTFKNLEMENITIKNIKAETGTIGGFVISSEAIIAGGSYTGSGVGGKLSIYTGGSDPSIRFNGKWGQAAMGLGVMASDTSLNAYGRFENTDPSSIINVGVYAKASGGSRTPFAVYASGNILATGQMGSIGYKNHNISTQGSSIPFRNFPEKLLVYCNVPSVLQFPKRTDIATALNLASNAYFMYTITIQVSRWSSRVAVRSVDTALQDSLGRIVTEIGMDPGQCRTFIYTAGDDAQISILG